MTHDPESRLFDFAASKREPETEDEMILTELHSALGTGNAPLRLRRPPTLAPTPRWHGYMYTAVTFALVVAVATAGIFALREETGTPPPTEVPEVVLGLASQEPDQASPVASATCDFTGDVPIFSAIDESPIDGPSVLVNLNGEMKLFCNGEDTLLAEGVMMANPTQTPHVLLAMTQDGPLLMNIVTGESLLIPLVENTEQSISISPQAWGDWMVLPSSDDNNLASVYNLKSLREHPIEASDGRVELASLANAWSVLSATGDTFVMPISVNRETDSTYLSGFVIASSGGSVRFVATDPDPAPRRIAVSPNGEMIAASSYLGEPGGGSTSTSIYSAADGSVLDTWKYETRDTFFDLTWLDDGSALLFSNGSALYKLASPGAEPELLLEGKQLQGLTLTNNPNIVTIWYVANANPGQGEFRTAIVNTETGDVTELNGRDLWAGPTYAAKRTTLLLAENVDSRPGQTETLTAIDATTGESVGEFEYTVPDHRGFSQSSWGNERGDIEVLAYSPDSMWLLVDENGSPTLEEITPPPLDPEVQHEAVLLTISPEGYMTLRVFEPGSTWLMLPGEKEWIQVDLPGPEESSQGVHPTISFIPGADSDVNTSAQEDPEKAQPAPATPIASPVASATCDVSGDTPLFMGVDTPPLDDTSLLVTSTGEIKLVCDGQETTLATDVDFAFPMSVPNTLLVETANGAILINIASGDSLQLPYSAMSILENQHLIATWGSWMVAPSTDDTNLASIYDLRTLAETPITGPGNHHLQGSAIAGLSVNPSDTHAAVAVSFNHSSSSRYLQGFFIVDTNGEHRFVHTQSDVLPRTIALSPDGQTIATSWYQGTMEAGETNISLYDANDGNLIHSWNLPTTDLQSEITWLNDGSGLVFTDGNGLYMIDPEHPGDGLRVLLEGEQVSGILLTPDPRMVAVSTTEQSTSGPPSATTAIINIDSGETTLLEGQDLWASSYGPASTRTVLLLLDLFGWHSENSLVMTVIDAATGEQIGEIEHAPEASLSISNTSSQRDRGDVTLFTMGPETIWQLLDEDGQPSLQQIELPDSVDAPSVGDAMVAMDRDGRIALTLADPFETWLWIPEANGGEWIEVDATLPNNELGILIVMMFIPGTD